MSDQIDARLSALGLSLPDAPAPAANYVPYVQSGSLVFISGQVAKKGDALICGQLGTDTDIEGGYAAARACGLNLVAQLKAACGGDLGRLRRVVKLTGFVNAAPDFTDHPKVMNGASDLMVALFDDAGRHARAAVGSPSLPGGVAVEVEGIFEID
ncbi:RidA family protein [Oceanomicrobium pacificus]|uniref:RidA family protein n=1 Tax=Oceanomicrobium pacificus TaxID=2692916 RepID=A0A6B0TK98_9RHOB|nr:RidA family protein [Oceanomicrobium pacificus]MXU64887.1 RidA family protein [Oceanomicrobium pacificus]